jgi:hypothetical protein
MPSSCRRLIPLMFLTILVVGCASGKSDMREPVSTPFDNLLFLKNGVTKEQIINELGYPFNCHIDGKVLTYLMFKNKENKNNDLYNMSDVTIVEERHDTYIDDDLFWYSIVLVFDDETKQKLENTSLVSVRRPRWAYSSNEGYILGESMVQIWGIDTNDPNHSRCEVLQ